MFNEIVCHEFPAIGKYRVRLVKEDAKAPVTLDIREYVGNPGGAPARGASGAPLKGVNGGSSKSLSKDGFEGFTRRGIKLSTTREIMELRDALTITLSMLEVKVEKLSKQ